MGGSLMARRKRRWRRRASWYSYFGIRGLHGQRIVVVGVGKGSMTGGWGSMHMKAEEGKRRRRTEDHGGLAGWVVIH